MGFYRCLSNLNLLLINWLKKILRSSTVYINKSPWNISTVAGTVFFDVTRNTARWHPSWFWMSLGKKKKLASRSYYILFDLAIIDYGSFCDTIPQNKCCHLHHYVVWLQLIFIFCRIFLFITLLQQLATQPHYPPQWNVAFRGVNPVAWSSNQVGLCPPFKLLQASSIPKLFAWPQSQSP